MTAPTPRGEQSPDSPNPHLAWIVEWGAISLPLGHPSRVTSLSIHHDEHEAAQALYEAGKDFNARMWPISLNVDGMPGLTPEIAGRSALPPAPREMSLTDEFKPDWANYEEGRKCGRAEILEDVPPASEWLRLRQPETYAAWLAGSLTPSQGDWMAGWDALRAILAASAPPASVETPAVREDRDLHSHMMIVATRATATAPGERALSHKEMLRAVCRAITDDKNLMRKLAASAPKGQEGGK